MRVDGRKHPPFMPDPGHGLSEGELGRPPPGLQLARWGRTRASIRGRRLSSRRARPPSRSAAHRSVVFVDFCSLSVHSQRQRPCSENASQCCCASRLSRFAGSIGELRRRAGRSIHALRRATENAASVRRFIDYARVVKCNRICPSGQVQLLHLVKVARVVRFHLCERAFAFDVFFDVTNEHRQQSHHGLACIHFSGKQKGKERVPSTLRFRKFPWKTEGVWCSILETRCFP